MGRQQLGSSELSPVELYSPVFDLRSSLASVPVSRLGGKQPSRSIYHPTQEEISGAGEMAQWLRTQTTIPEDLDLILRTRMEIHNHL